MFVSKPYRHLVGLSRVTADADIQPSHLCDGMTDCQNGRRASIGNSGTISEYRNHKKTVDALKMSSDKGCSDKCSSDKSNEG